ncbi:hypothetical protein [Halorubrum sp. CSM-61]|uniref:hypothetical protein n=1 Tax=Halorubrum sp. CSM-61 TaxID=2485838 RepID=UPI000F4C011B
MKDGLPAAGRSPGPNASPAGSVRGSLAFLALIALGVLVAAYPLASLAALTGVVALAIFARSLARHVDRETVGRVSLPGLGTVEYRFTRS